MYERERVRGRERVKGREREWGREGDWRWWRCLSGAIAVGTRWGAVKYLWLIALIIRWENVVKWWSQCLFYCCSIPPVDRHRWHACCRIIILNTLYQFLSIIAYHSSDDDIELDCLSHHKCVHAALTIALMPCRHNFNVADTVGILGLLKDLCYHPCMLWLQPRSFYLASSLS